MVVLRARTAEKRPHRQPWRRLLQDGNPVEWVTYHLGSLIETWGQPLSSSNVAGITGLPIVVYVTDNGTPVRL